MVRIEHILVPTDFSEPANYALSYGLALARQFHASLHVCHVVSNTTVLSYAFPESSLDLERKLFETAQEAIDRLVPDKLREFTKVTTEVRIGDIQDELIGSIDKEGADLVVIGTHGRRAFERWVIGSVAEKFLRRAPVPVLTVSHLDPAHQISAVESAPVRKILFATDLVDTDSRGLQYAIELAVAFRAELVVAHVMERPRWIYDGGLIMGYPELDRDKIKVSAENQLNTVLPSPLPEGLKASTVLDEGVPHERLLRIAEEHHADLIVMNMHSKSVMERALLGYTAERVIRSSTIPVLSVPRPGGEVTPRPVPAKLARVMI